MTDPMLSRLQRDIATELICPIHHSQDPDRPRRPANGAMLCGGHIQQGRDILAALAELDDELAVIAAPSGQASQGSRNAEKPIPYHEKAANHRRTLRGCLVGWCRTVATERDLDPEWLTGDTDEMTTFLARHHDWAVGQQWAEEYAEDLREIHAAARGLLSRRPPGEATRVPCPAPEGCEGMLIAPFRDAELLNRDDIGSVHLVCRECGWMVQASEWLALARASGNLDAMLVTDQEAEIWTSSVGQRISANTIRSWAHRGHITRHDIDGRVLFDLDEIEKRIATRADQVA
jgi:hypothetical protein